MTFKQKIAVLMILATIQLPCTIFAAEEDKDLALIAAEQKKSADDEKLDDINPALNDSLSTKPKQETDKEKKERKKKLYQTRKEKEKVNEQKLKRSEQHKDDTRHKDTVVIAEEEPPIIKPQPTLPPQSTVVPKKTAPVVESAKPTLPPQSTVVPVKSEPAVEPAKPQLPPQSTVVVPVSNPVKPPTIAPHSTPSTIKTVSLPDEKIIYANFVEVAQAVHFTPLYMPRKSGYEITAIYAGQGIVEVRYGRRWEPNVSLTIRTYKRKDGEELQDISGVSGVKWRVDTSTGTTIYIAKISETQQVAAWAVGHYTFSAQSDNLSFASFHSLVADELVELSTHYYLDL